MKNPGMNSPQVRDGTYLIDTHCHLDMEAYEKLDEIIASSIHAGISRIITVGIDVASSYRAAAIASRFRNIYAAVGVHPHSAAAVKNKSYRELESLVDKYNSRIVGYGEIGLDYAKKYAPRDVQLKEFNHQLNLAKNLNLPVIIHDREAHEDILGILKNNTPFPAGGVMHCFSGDTYLARQIIDLGMYISIPGIITFPGTETLQQVVREISLEHLLLETDGPFLAPVPFRGKTNEPRYLLYTAKKIAEIKNISLDEVARQTSTNAETLFSLRTGGAVK